jgi:hypothetical protein
MYIYIHTHTHTHTHTHFVGIINGGISLSAENRGSRNYKESQDFSIKKNTSSILTEKRRK